MLHSHCIFYDLKEMKRAGKLDGKISDVFFSS